MTSKDSAIPMRGPNGPEDDLNSKPNSNINIQKTPVSLLQVIKKWCSGPKLSSVEIIIVCEAGQI